MISQLFIQNVAVIQKATIDFTAGFNVFTGETGAGKTILIQAINAVLGERTSKDIVRTGEEKAVVSALFTAVRPEIQSLLESLGYEPSEDNSILISREISADSGSSCRVNGRPATVSILKQIAGGMINIHGQHDNQQLLSPEKHLQFIDNYGDTTIELEYYRQIYRQICETQEKLSQLNLDEQQKAQQIDLLSYQINEIDAAHLQIGEEEELTAQRKIIKNSEKIQEAVGFSKELLHGTDESEGILSLYGDLLSSMDTAGEYVAEMQGVTQRLHSLYYDLEECGEEISSYLDDFEYDPRRLDEIEDRLETIHRLKRKYGSSEEAILQFCEQARSQLEQINLSDQLISQLQNQLAQLTAEGKQAAKALSILREKKAGDFIKKVEEELVYLDMPSVKLALAHSVKEMGANGMDEMEFLISANPGEPPKSMAKIASGGELSRIMLAIKNVLANKDAIDTLIFDEVDAGVSGRAAQKIGAKLQQVAKNRQVICVTHLAQVAAFAANHLKIYKTVKDGRTFTAVEVLDRNGRKEELARIIGGELITETALQNADELLKFSGN